MKTQKIIPLVLCSILSVSCSMRGSNSSSDKKTYDILPLSTGYFSSAVGKVRLKDSDDILSPFNTTISGNVLSVSNTYDEKTHQAMQDEFSYDFYYYHALLDRHNYYTLYEDENQKSDDRKPIENIKTINDSYGTGKEIACDPFLYDVLKESYQFTLNSNLKFNMFLGTLNEVYEPKLARLQKDMNSLDVTMTLINKATFSSDFDSEEISQIVSSLPSTKEEVKSLLTFNDEKKTVRFNRIEKADNLEISLGGNGKGFATEAVSRKFKEEYPGISLIINSGTSSIKAVGTRPDGKYWNISYANPVYQEALNTSANIANPYNKSEVALKKNGEFNISTSGYYEQYFYVYDGDDDFKRRSHIVDSRTGYSHQFFDQISVLIDNTGLADMYTTALMNTDSVEECKTLFDNLNSIYNEKDASIILCYKTAKDESYSPYEYKMSELTDTYEYNGKIYPSVTLKDGSKYRGDYSDFDSSSFFRQDGNSVIDSKAVRNFQETYKVSKNLTDGFYLLDADNYPNYIPYRNNILSRIEADL